MPYVPGKKVISTDEQGDPVYEDVGPTPRFMELHAQEPQEARGRGSRRQPPRGRAIEEAHALI